MADTRSLLDIIKQDNSSPEKVLIAIEAADAKEIHAKDSENYSPLWYAFQQAISYNASKKWVEVVAALFKKGANPNETYPRKYVHFGTTSLLIECLTRETPKELTYLILKQPKVNLEIRDSSGLTPLHALAKDLSTSKIGVQNKIEILNVLIEMKADVNANTENYSDAPGKTPLHFAAIAGNKEIIKILHAAGADLEAVDENKNTPLLAAYKLDGIQVLLDLGANPNQGQDNLAHIAAKCGNIEFLKQAIESKIDINRKNSKGESPLLIATRVGSINPGCISFLLENKADIKATNKQGENALHIGLNFNYDNNVFKQLISELQKLDNETLKSVLEMQDNKGSTPLHLASDSGFEPKYKYDSVAPLYKKSGATLELKNKNGQTAFQVTINGVGYCKLLITQKLLDLRADIYSRDKYLFNSLDIAKRSYDDKIYSLILQEHARRKNPPPELQPTAFTNVIEMKHTLADDELFTNSLAELYHNEKPYYEFDQQLVETKTTPSRNPLIRLFTAFYSWGVEDKASINSKFKHQFQQLLKAIQDWGKENDMSQGLLANIHGFYNHLFVNAGLKQPPFFFRDIKNNLEYILFLLHNSDMEKPLKISTLAELAGNLGVCGAGVFHQIEHTRYALQNPLSISYWLAEFRTNLITLFAERHIAEHKISAGSSIHAHTVLLDAAMKKGWAPLTTITNVKDLFADHARVTPEVILRLETDFLEKYNLRSILNFLNTSFIAELNKEIKEISGKMESKEHPGWIQYDKRIIDIEQGLIKRLGLNIDTVFERKDNLIKFHSSRCQSAFVAYCYDNDFLPKTSWVNEPVFKEYNLIHSCNPNFKDIYFIQDKKTKLLVSFNDLSDEEKTEYYAYSLSHYQAPDHLHLTPATSVAHYFPTTESFNYLVRQLEKENQLWENIWLFKALLCTQDQSQLLAGLEGLESSNAKRLADIISESKPSIQKDREKTDSVFGDILLYAAVRKNDFKAILRLLDARADVNAINEYNVTPIFAAVEMGHYDCMKFLAANGADLNVGNRRGETLLYLAASKGDLNTVKFLIAHGVYLEGDRRHSPLAVAAENNHKEIVEALLAAGALSSSWSIDIDGKKTQPEIQKMILKAGINTYLRIYSEEMKAEKKPTFFESKEDPSYQAMLSLKNAIDENFTKEDFYVRPEEGKLDHPRLSNKTIFILQEHPFKHYFDLAITLAPEAKKDYKHTRPR